MTCNEEAACIVFMWMQILPENVKGLILFVANIQVMYDPVKTGFLY
jgi:hypothetical protein